MSEAVESTMGSALSRLPSAALSWALQRCPPFTGARAITTALRLAGAEVAASTIWWGMPTLAGPGAHLKVGELCGLNFGCHFQLDAPITLEPHVAVGHEVMFLTRTYDSSQPEQRGRPSGAKPITIEAGCWLGSRCTILSGVTVGAGSVIGALAVVRENVPPNTLILGARRVSLAKWRG